MLLDLILCTSSGQILCRCPTHTQSGPQQAAHLMKLKRLQFKLECLVAVIEPAGYADIGPGTKLVTAEYLAVLACQAPYNTLSLVNALP